jgi:hypothetical protein
MWPITRTEAAILVGLPDCDLARQVAGVVKDTPVLKTIEGAEVWYLLRGDRMGFALEGDPGRNGNDAVKALRRLHKVVTFIEQRSQWR